MLITVGHEHQGSSGFNCYFTVLSSPHRQRYTFDVKWFSQLTDLTIPDNEGISARMMISHCRRNLLFPLVCSLTPLLLYLWAIFLSATCFSFFSFYVVHFIFSFSHNSPSLCVRSHSLVIH